MTVSGKAICIIKIEEMPPTSSRRRRWRLQREPLADQGPR